MHIDHILSDLAAPIAGPKHLKDSISFLSLHNATPANIDAATFTTALFITDIRSQIFLGSKTNDPLAHTDIFHRFYFQTVHALHLSNLLKLRLNQCLTIFRKNKYVSKYLRYGNSYDPSIK